jgi:hypothetical protein
MADDEHVEMLRKGAAAWDRWQGENACARRANTELVWRRATPRKGSMGVRVLARSTEGRTTSRARSVPLTTTSGIAIVLVGRSAGGYCNIADLCRDGQLGPAPASLSVLAVVSG